MSREWLHADMESYLDRCQVDTPDDLVARLWNEINRRRCKVDTVVDFGAGDGRFARHGHYANYRGYEIDAGRLRASELPTNATIVHGCAFASEVEAADVAIGNPPFVRNQDLPDGWRTKVSDRLYRKTGIRLSGLANAWQYFFLQSLASTKHNGMCALIIPFEWVSRPSVAAIRDYVRAEGWDVDVIRLSDSTFGGVLTTASITLIDKKSADGQWRYFEDSSGETVQIASPSRSDAGHIPYFKFADDDLKASRGLSPGSQKIFTFTESERARLGLKRGRDVVRCITSLKPLDPSQKNLDDDVFQEVYCNGGQRCWLMNTARPNSRALRDYLDSVPLEARSTKTCTSRPVWWKYEIPNVPDLVVATCFKGSRPKHAINSAGVIAVGGVAGVVGGPKEIQKALFNLRSADLSDRIVAHANGLFKIEIAQLNTLIRDPNGEEGS